MGERAAQVLRVGFPAADDGREGGDQRHGALEPALADLAARQADLASKPRPESSALRRGSRNIHRRSRPSWTMQLQRGDDERFWCRSAGTLPAAGGLSAWRACRRLSPARRPDDQRAPVRRGCPDRRPPGRSPAPVRGRRGRVSALACSSSQCEALRVLALQFQAQARPGRVGPQAAVDGSRTPSKNRCSMRT